jgi:hypothetical protein
MKDDVQISARQQAKERLSAALASRGMHAELRERDPIEKSRVLANAVLGRLIQIWAYDLGRKVASEPEVEIRWVVSSMSTITPAMSTLTPHTAAAPGLAPEFFTAEEAIEHAWNLLVRIRDDARKAMGEYLAP